jgi:hypothetical protein
MSEEYNNKMSEEYNNKRRNIIHNAIGVSNNRLRDVLTTEFKYLDDKIDSIYTYHQINRINSINNFIINNYNKFHEFGNEEYDDDNDEYIYTKRYEFVMIYDKNNNEIKLNNKPENSIDIFNDKLGSIFNNKINIFLSTGGYILYEYDGRYSRYLIESENVKISDFDDYRKNHLNRLGRDVDNHYIPKIYKSYLINSIKIDPELTLTESIKYLGKFEYNHNKLCYELDFMENEFCKKLNNQNTLILDLQTKLDEQLKLNETLCKRLFELKN